jgi:colanic acid/amylovoran biosynthesis protein
MNWLIVGGNLKNKGAELMLLSVSDKIFNHRPHDKVVVAGSAGDIRLLREKGFCLLDYALPHIGTNWKFIPIVKYGNLYKYIKKKYRGDIALKKIDVVLDISGFAFGESWGINPLKNISFLVKFLREKGIQYIFLPQAFGPFKDELSKNLMKKTINESLFCFARDVVSFNYLKDLDLTTKKITVSPDITLRSSKQHITNEDYVSFIPNERMLDKAGDFWKKNYINIAIESIRKIIIESVYSVKIIIHDQSPGDFSISQTILKEFPERVEIIDLEDPVKIKKIIAGSQFLISSRYHGLAVGLSNNVPSIAIGWSHKYLQLLEDYELKDFVITDEEDVRKLNELIIKLIDKLERENIRRKLIDKNVIINQKIESMWEKVFLLTTKS